MNLASNLPIYIFEQPTIGGLDSVVASIVTAFGALWLGIILFTIILKTVMLPLDYFSRASMRKMSVKMEKMRPELEKLQKQYADNKEMYNQKMMALYKKNNVNMFGSCLPTILSLVLFIVVLNAFNSFSTYQNKLNYYDMSLAFNNAVYQGIEINDTVATVDENGIITFKDNEIYTILNGTSGTIQLSDGVAFNVVYDTVNTPNKVIYSSTNSYITVEKTMSFSGAPIFDSNTQYNVKVDGLQNSVLLNEQNNNLKNSEGKTFTEYFNSLVAVDPTADVNTAGYNFIKNIQQLMAKNTYNTQKESFLWIHNIWQPDSAFQKEIPSVWSTTSEYQASYEDITGLMTQEKGQVNGYFILVVLTALSSILQQLVLNKSQKAQMQFQSVNGQGMSTQKVMLWMMPIMMGVFALFYTSAFALYIIISSLYTLLSTFGINKIVDIQIKREEKKENNPNKNRSTKVRKEEPKKETKQSKKEVKNDFLSYNDKKTVKEVKVETEEELKEKEAKRKQSISKKKQKRNKK